MQISSRLKISGQVPDLPLQDIAKSLYDDGINEAGDWQASEFYMQTILPLRTVVEEYTFEFDNAVQAYMRENSVLRKMKNSLNTNSRSTDKIGLTRGKYQNNKQSTQHLMTTMLKGHSLLLQVRQALTGQSINTKFIIQVDNKVYQIDESQINPNLVLSKFGGGTVSNPFSLAYQIDLEMLESYKILSEENEITKTDIWQTIINLKPEYLEQKKQYWARLGVKKEYPNIFFDSKDAEIYELYSQQTNIPELTVSQYATLRKEMGGGGGYATPFYKMGDIASTQVKFFNLSKNAKNATVNFARFSLLRDRMRQLSQIFSLANPIEMREELVKFFTEKESNVTQIVSQEFNKAAQDAIRVLFSGFG